MIPDLTYHGYDIRYDRGIPPYEEFEDVVLYNFHVYKDNQEIFRLIYGASELYLRIRDISESGKQGEFVRIRGLKRLCAILDLEKFKKGEKQEYILETDYLGKTQQALSDSEIHHEILKGFYNIFKNYPGDYKSQHLEGVCELLDIEQNQYQRNLNWLVAKGYLEHLHNDPKSGTYITGKGLELVESEEKAGTVVESIFRDTRKFVDAELMQVCPEVFKKLTETYKGLESGQSKLNWSQVAFACRDILQDFTEAIFKDEYVPPGAMRPPRDKTIIKIRYIIKNTTKSETEEIFVPALAEYLLQYFEGLNKLIQKHTHGSPDIEKEDANRCLIYTYLLIRDVLKIIKG